jgi:GTP-binding protein YchF
MKLTITGFSNSGKTTLFNALTGLNIEPTTYPTSISAAVEPHIGVVKVPDTRGDKLADIFITKKTTYATIEYIDFFGITSSASGGDVSQNAKVFNLIKDSDAIVHVVRGFEHESIMHPLHTVDPVRDVKSFEADLILGDLEFVEKRLERIVEAAKKGKKQDEADRQLLLKCKKALDDEIPLHDIDFNEEENRLMLPYQFLTTIPEIIVLNIDERDINSDKVRNLKDEIETFFKEKGGGTTPHVLSLCGKIEMELVQLTQDEAKVFLDDLGIDEPAMQKLCKISCEALDLISFFTVIKDEVRSWMIKKGSDALHAAGKIHTDIERGFIKAEVVHYGDFISSDEDIHKAKERGLVRLEGKMYPVQDGDIINFKFNV